MIIINNFFGNCLLCNTSYTFTNLNKIIGNFNINYLELFGFNKNKLKSKLHEKMGKGDWQYNILEEVMNMKETSLEANLDITEIRALIENVSIVNFYSITHDMVLLSYTLSYGIT